MRVAFITRDYPPAIGGISTHASSLVKALRGLGVDIDVFVGGTDYGTLVVPLVRSLEDYDLVHVQSSPYGALVRGIPLVVTVHSPVLVEWSHYAPMAMFKSVPAFLLEKITFQNARAILAVSETTISDLVTRYGIRRDRISLIGNGVDHERFSPSDEKERGPNRILLVSRLEPRKNVEESLRALARLPQGSYEAKLAGDGSQREKLEGLSKSLGVNISFLGKVNEASLPALYREASIFLTSSSSEGFGLTLLEAMATGCAVVASNIPTHRHLVRSGENGLIYSDASQLEAQLKSLLADPGMGRRLGSTARSTAKEFSWESVARRVLEAYERCLRR